MKSFKEFINENKDIDKTKHQVGHYSKGEFKVFSTHDHLRDAQKSYEIYKNKNKKATIVYPHKMSDGQISGGSVMDIHRNKE